jgi:hypothetical protein
MVAMRRHPHRWIGLALLVLLVPLARGMAIDIDTLWPVERIVANLEARCAQDPSDVGSRYTLGRAHAFAFVLERASLFAFVNDDGAWLRDWWKQERSVERGENPEEPRPAPSELLAHLGAAVRELTRTTELAPEQPEHHLTLAWILETGAHLADRLDTGELFGVPRANLTDEQRGFLSSRLRDLRADDASRADEAFTELLAPEWLERAVGPLSELRVSSSAAAQTRISRLLERFWVERSIARYRRAWELGVAREIHDGVIEYPDFGSLVTKEAGPAYLRLARARGLREEEQAFAASIEATLAQMEHMPVQGGFITPLLFSLRSCKSLEELLTPALQVPFDLDGDGIDELWPWIEPDAGWLVWDPENRGEITSGQQLFGSASAWLFFEDGYRVLDALDDDRDGELRGAELTGIAVWFDRDTDGVSDRGEVVPVEELGIVALSAQATMQVDASPANLCGVEMKDGRVLPTYDWVLASVEGP